MSRADSPYVVGDYWLDMRPGGRSPFWHIARYEVASRQIKYRSTSLSGVEDAKAFLDAFFANQRSLVPQKAEVALVVPVLMTYWREKGSENINADQTGRSIKTFTHS